MMQRLLPTWRASFSSSHHFSTTAVRSFRSTSFRYQQPTQSSPHGTYWKTHGRALFKSLTLAFFSYQCFYWAWITLETEEIKDEKDREIKSLQGELRLLEEGRNSHRPDQLLNKEDGSGKRLLEESKS